mmetsp:Transcript_35489/g.49694  ORF Transcript_35489/g.49694 Transcript_35489/m.49694 type:complete len:92 (-) Transcript_35489:109-384(-)
MDRIVSLINDGASLDEFWSYGIVCTGWRHAKELLSRVRKGKLQLAAGDDMLRQMEDIVLGNIKVHNRRFGRAYADLLKNPDARVYLEGNKP